MPKFSKTSLERLATCDFRLQELCQEAIKVYDFSVICGHRNEQDQNKAFATGNSPFHWPNSKHNATPSLAIDLAPYPVDWNDRERFKLFSNIVINIANKLDIKIRWGGEFRKVDLPHYELIG